MNKKFKNILCVLLLMMVLIFTGCDSSARVDIDLSTMTTTVVQSTIYEMQSKSTQQQYKGKVIKLKVKAYEDGNYHYIRGLDNRDICCSWEMPIKLGSGVSDYPESDKKIILIGKYTYGAVYSGYTDWHLEVIEYEYKK